MYALLLAYDADPDYKNKAGKTPSAFAHQWARENVIDKAYEIRHSWYLYPTYVAIVFWQGQRQHHKQLAPYLFRRIFSYIQFDLYDPYQQLITGRSREELLNTAQDQVTEISAKLVVKNSQPGFFFRLFSAPISAERKQLIADFKTILDGPNESALVSGAKKQADNKDETSPEPVTKAMKIRAAVRAFNGPDDDFMKLLFKYKLKRPSPPAALSSSSTLAQSATTLSSSSKPV